MKKNISTGGHALLLFFFNHSSIHQIEVFLDARSAMKYNQSETGILRPVNCILKEVKPHLFFSHRLNTKHSDLSYRNFLIN